MYTLMSMDLNTDRSVKRFASKLKEENSFPHITLPALGHVLGFVCCIAKAMNRCDVLDKNCVDDEMIPQILNSM